MPHRVETFARAARSRLASEGLSGLNLRSVAREAGASLGSLAHLVGSKAALIDSIAGIERIEREKRYGSWKQRAAGLDLRISAILAPFLIAYLEELAVQHRESALVGCELLLEAGRDAVAVPGVAKMVDEEDAFWIDLLRPGYGSRAELFGAAVAAYCRDELPFSVAMAHDADYSLLRFATATRLCERFAGEPAGLAAHFEGLMVACGDEAAAAPLPVDLQAGSRKADLAAHIAAVIAERGVAGVTHRAVAARAAVANSSVAYHFRTYRDLVEAGMGALVLGMRSELRSETAPNPDFHYAFALVRATHSVTLLAAREAEYRPLALDLRRRRGENNGADVAAQLGIRPGGDRGGVQAAVMVMVGSALGALAQGRRGTIFPATLAGLRTGEALDATPR